MSNRYFGLRTDEFLTDSSRTKFNVGAGRPPLAYVKPVILRVKRIKYILQRKTLACCPVCRRIDNPSGSWCSYKRDRCCIDKFMISFIASLTRIERSWDIVSLNLGTRAVISLNILSSTKSNKIGNPKIVRIIFKKVQFWIVVTWSIWEFLQSRLDSLCCSRCRIPRTMPLNLRNVWLKGKLKESCLRDNSLNWPDLRNIPVGDEHTLMRYSMGNMLPRRSLWHPGRQCEELSDELRKPQGWLGVSGWIGLSLTWRPCLLRTWTAWENGVTPTSV